MGLGIGFPIISLETLFIGYKNLSRNDVTSWDREGNYIVSHVKIGPMHVVFVLMFFIGILLIFNQHSHTIK
jgi:hypothetical protein